MTPDSDRPGWFRGHYADLFSELDERAGERIDLPVLSVTKSRGPMLASERFGKVMHGRDLSRYRRAPKDHVVADPMLLWDGSIGIQSVVDLGLVSPDYRVYAPTTNADPSFAGFLVRSPAMLPFYQGGARGTNVRRNRIARSDFLGIPVGIPPLPEQRKIAAILSSLDEAIEGTQAVIDQLQVVKKAVMADLLTRGIPGRHKSFKQTDIGEIPAEWRIASVGSVAEIVTGSTPSTTNADYWGSGFPFVTPGDLGGSRLVRQTDREVTAAGLAVSRGLPARSVLVTCIGSSIGKIGMSAGDCCTNQQINAMVCEAASIVPEYAYYLMLWNKPAILERASQTAVPIINKSAFSSVLVALPCLEEQAQIAAALAVVDDRVDVENGIVSDHRGIKSALMSVLLTGEVRVRIDGEAAGE